MKKFAVVLAGCGVYDGAEIQEAVLTLLAIDKQGASYQCFAPDVPQAHVINHLKGEESAESRNVLVESARIARGMIQPLREYDQANFNGLIFPGGFGAAKNLCDWAFKGDDCAVNPDVETAIRSTYKAGKPIGMMCIAPVILAKLFNGTNLTTGQDPASGGFIEKMGNTYTRTTHGEVVIDHDRKFFSTPCYMLDASISQIAAGAENIVREMLDVM
ncbi:MAG: isoprenoid biosynthesis protein ElbB [Bacteroidetes bacterium]|nr:MAG: isoprenoid biosynthesis protein ElbB [Bacteroidota bacterium]